AEQILRTFNTWSFKREQPSDIGLMLNVISHTISRAVGAQAASARNPGSGRQGDFRAGVAARIRESASKGSRGRAPNCARGADGSGSMKPSLRVLSPGLSTTVQDLGRPGHQWLGIPVGGALDPVSLRAANGLVGNP